ncbi:MAG TPA: hypothetical protein VK914_03765 [bacterium]|nr:hypothetical protein [bacterium]
MKSKLKKFLLVACVVGTPGLCFAGFGGNAWDGLRSAFSSLASEASCGTAGAATLAQMDSPVSALRADGPGGEIVLEDRGPRHWHRHDGYGYGYGIGAVVLVAVLVTVLVLVLL